MFLLPLLMSAASLAIQPAAETPSTYLPTSGWRDADSARLYEWWFGNQLRAMNEPSLAQRESLRGLRQRFRLLVLPTFAPGYAYRIDEREDRNAMLHWVRLNGRGGYAPGIVAARGDRALRPDEVRALNHAIAAADLDHSPREVTDQGVHKNPDGTESVTICADSVAFGIEVRNEGGWRFVALYCAWPAPLAHLIRTVIRLRPSAQSR
jgi:hypothetical protein